MTRIIFYNNYRNSDLNKVMYKQFHELKTKNKKLFSTFNPILKICLAGHCEHGIFIQWN